MELTWNGFRRLSIGAGQMSNYSYRASPLRVDRIPDRAAFDTLKRIVTESGLTATRLMVNPIYILSEIESSYTDPQGEFRTILQQESTLVQKFRIETSSGLTVSLSRGLTSESWTSYDTFEVTGANSQVPFELFAKAYSSGRKHFRSIDRSTILEHLSNDQQQFLQQRESALSRLEDMSAGLFRKFQDFALEQAETARKNRHDLEEEYRNRAAELEQDYKVKLQKLHQEIAEFEEKKQELDLRDSTVVRRSIRETVRTLLGERAKGFDLSKPARNRRSSVAWGYSGLLIVIGVLAGAFIIKDFDASISASPSPWLIGRQIAFVAGFMITAGFFIRWLNASAQRHADEEFQTRKYELDFERASFVVEWAMEWAKDEKDVPQFLIERLSRGLFDFQATESGSATAADAVASALFGNAASAKLKIGNNEIVLDRQGIKRLKKSASDENHE